MTAALPDAVVERVRAEVARVAWGEDEAPDAAANSPLADAIARAALAEFLRIIEERAGPGWMIALFTPDLAGELGLATTMPLAELLEGRDDGS